MALASGLPEQVGRAETLARFIQQSNRINSAGARHTAFMPYQGETSIFRHGGEDPPSLWAHARAHLNPGAGVTRAAALFEASLALGLGLTVEADEPPPLHAVLRAWPVNDDGDLERARREDVARKLAAGSRLLLVSGQ